MEQGQRSILDLSFVHRIGGEGGAGDVDPLRQPPEPASSVAGSSLPPATVGLSPSDLERFLGESHARRSFLAVSSSSEEHVLLKQTFRGTCWELREAHSYRDALMILCHERMPVVICQCSLPDGNWQDVLGQTAILPDAPRLIVTSAQPDEHLWAEVLNMGRVRRINNAVRQERSHLGSRRCLAKLGYRAETGEPGMDKVQGVRGGCGDKRRRTTCTERNLS